MSDRSGCSSIELASLLAADRCASPRLGVHLPVYPGEYVGSNRVVALAGTLTGLGPRQSWELLLDLARPWLITVPLIGTLGNIGSHTWPNVASAPRHVECRVSHAGQAVLDAEARLTGRHGRKGGSPRATRHRITPPRQPRYRGGPRPRQSPPADGPPPAGRTRRPPPRQALHRRPRRPRQPQPQHHPPRHHTPPGSEPAAVREILLAHDGITSEIPAAYPAPLATLLRTWARQHRHEDITDSLTRFEDAIRQDQDEPPD